MKRLALVSKFCKLEAIERKFYDTSPRQGHLLKIQQPVYRVGWVSAGIGQFRRLADLMV